jgi:NAD(P)H-dependent FMN reductase
MADKRNDVSFELIDLRDYKIPFLNDDIPPANRKEITDLNIKAWSDKIKEGDAYIILSPEYNSSIPGVLKNALDSLYVEWNNKPAAVITYSGGPLGGANAMNHLNQILSALEMKVIKENIKIPSSWKALNDQGNLTDNNIEKEFNIMLDELKK